MYAIFFDDGNTTYRLPTNPEKIEITSVQANEKYVILNGSQIVVPTNTELSEYSFEAEFPHDAQHYVETSAQFHDFDYYDALFKKWRVQKKAVRFIAHNGILKDINTLVLIEECGTTENGGEEGDIYVAFKLLECPAYGKKEVVAKKAKKTTATTKNPKSKGKHTVKKGETLFSIAKKYYGNGAKYMTIFNANKKLIKHPNLLKAGMVLTIP